MSLEMGCVQLWHCLPKERGGDTWEEASKRVGRVVWGAASFIVNGYISKYLSHGSLWPRRCSWNQGLQETKIRRS